MTEQKDYIITEEQIRKILELNTSPYDQAEAIGAVLRGNPCSPVSPIRLKGAKCKNKPECNQYKREGITKNCIGCGSLIRGCEP